MMYNEYLYSLQDTFGRLKFKAERRGSFQNILLEDDEEVQS